MNTNEAKMELYSIANELHSRASTTTMLEICDRIRNIADRLDHSGYGLNGGDVTPPPTGGVLVLPKPYCVIGASVRTDRVVARTWREQKAEAESHASDLLARVGNEACQELLVVRAVSMVRRRRNHEVIDVEVRS